MFPKGNKRIVFFHFVGEMFSFILFSCYKDEVKIVGGGGEIVDVEEEPNVGTPLLHVDTIAKCFRLSRLGWEKIKVIFLSKNEVCVVKVFVVIVNCMIVLTNIHLAMRTLGLSSLSHLFIPKYILVKRFAL